MKKEKSVQVSVFIATSLDGFICRPDGDVDWLHNVESPGEGEDCGFKKFFDSVDVLVLGRNSFEKVLEFREWPYGNKPVIILSRSLKEVPVELRDRVTIDTSSPEEFVEKLSEQGVGRIYLDGGKVIQSFLRAGMVDDMTITRIPILIGVGRSLFGELDDDVKLRHVGTQTWKNGFVQSEYAIAES